MIVTAGPQKNSFLTRSLLLEIVITRLRSQSTIPTEFLLEEASPCELPDDSRTAAALRPLPEGAHCSLVSAQTALTTVHVDSC